MNPGKVVLGAAAFILLGLGIGGTATARLTSGEGDYLDPASADATAYAAVQKTTGVDVQEGYVVVVRLAHHTSAGGAVPGVVARTVAILRDQPGVRTVADSWTTHDPNMISRDGLSTYVVAQLGALHSETTSYDRLAGAIEHTPALAGRVLIGGATAAGAQATEQATRDLTGSEEIGLPVLLVLLVLVFRGAVAALVPVMGALFSVAGALLGMAAIEPVHPLSVFALNLVVALGIGLSVDFSLLGVSRFREEVALGVPCGHAARRVRATAGRTTAFSAATVAAALGGLLVFPERGDLPRLRSPAYLPLPPPLGSRSWCCLPSWPGSGLGWTGCRSPPRRAPSARRAGGGAGRTSL